MIKNTAGQKWIVFAFNRTSNAPITGDAANITASLRLDGGAANPIDDTNPTELSGGYYAFDLTAAETNADLIVIIPVSATADVLVIGVPGAVWTEPSDRKYPATLAPADCSGNLPAQVKAQDDIDFGATQKASIEAAVPGVAAIQDGLATSAEVAKDATVMKAAGYTAPDNAGIAAILEDTGTTLPATLATIIASILAIGTGTGPVEHVYTVTNGTTALPESGVTVVMSTDALMANPIHRGVTDALGQVHFRPNVPTGTTVYLWRFKSGVDFVNPDSEVTHS